MRAISIALLLAAAGCGAPGMDAVAQNAGETPDRAQLASFVEQNAKRGVKAPDFGADRPWLNVARPLSFRGDFAGRVTLLDFWTYCCINCMHVLPDLDYLEHRFEGRPFAVVGVHSAKFENEKDADNIRQAVLRYDIRHPVVDDGNFAIWSAYAVNAWPTLVLVGPDGTILAILSGEGHRAVLEGLVDAALERYGAAGKLSAKPLPLLLERDKQRPGELAFPGKLVADAAHDRLYISDSNHDRVVVTTLSGRFVEAIGAGEAGLADGPFATARFRRPQGLALAGNTLYVADTENHALRAVDLAAKTVTTVAGNGKQGFDRRGGKAGPDLLLSSPWDLALEGGDLYIAMAGTHQLWRYEPAKGTLEAYAGSGSEARVDGPRREAALAQPSGLAVAGHDLVFADSESSSIRAVSLKAGTVRTLAGAKHDAGLFSFGDRDGKGFDAKLQHPLGVAVSGDVAYVADTYNHKIRRLDIASGALATLTGTGKPGAEDGPFASASFYEPSGLAVAGRRLFVADSDNHRIRVLDLDAKTVSTLELSGVPIPMTRDVLGRGGAASSDLRLLPNAVRRALPDARVRSGKVDLAVHVKLPADRHLTDGAPSAWQVIGTGGVRVAGTASGKIERTDWTVPLDVEGDGSVEVRLLVYHCQSDKDCRIASAGLTVPVHPDAHGAPSIAVEHAP